MNDDQIIKKIEEFVRFRLSKYDSGHDWWHIYRVRKLARYINEKENLADHFVLDVAALLHDSADSKFSGDNSEDAYRQISILLDNTGLNSLNAQVINVLKNVSFSNKNPSGNLKDPVLLIVQDADRLDAIGAIGVARAFNYGGFRNNIIYSPDKEQNQHSTITHFYHKLLILGSLMNTGTARQLAVERHEFLECFLKQFLKEWSALPENVIHLHDTDSKYPEFND